MPKRRACSPLPFGDLDDDYEDETCSNGSKQNLPVQRNAANARERARMRVLSSAFGRLKTKLPWVPIDTKLSKLDTLRLATIYIQQLRASLMTGAIAGGGCDDRENSAGAGCVDVGSNSNNNNNNNNGCSGKAKGSSMVWPFSFPQLIDATRMADAGSPAGPGLTHWLASTRQHTGTGHGQPEQAAQQTTHNAASYQHQHPHQHQLGAGNQSGNGVIVANGRSNYLCNSTAHG